MLLPRKQFEGKQPATPSEEERKAQDKVVDQNHKAEWVRAIREGKPELAWSNFSYSGVLTEAMLLGNVAVRLGQPVEFDQPLFVIR